MPSFWRTFMNISVVASSASSWAGSTRLQNRKIAAAYWRYSSPQASESPARTWDSNRAKSASLIVPVVLRSSIDLIRRLARNVSQLSQISGVVCEQMVCGPPGVVAAGDIRRGQTNSERTKSGPWVYHPGRRPWRHVALGSIQKSKIR